MSEIIDWQNLNCQMKIKKVQIIHNLIYFKAGIIWSTAYDATCNSNYN